MRLEEIQKQIKNIKLTEEERVRVFKHIEQIMENNPIPSPYAPRPGYKFVPRPVVYVLLSVLVLMITTGGVSFASMNTIPGDALYGIKVKVAEPLLDALVQSKSTDLQARWQATKAIRRLEEASKLAKVNKLTPEHRIALEENLNKNVEEFNKVVDSKEETGPAKTEEENLKVYFEASLSAHVGLIKKIGDQKEEEGDAQEKEITELENTVVNRISSIENKESDEKTIDLNSPSAASTLSEPTAPVETEEEDKGEEGEEPIDLETGESDSLPPANKETETPKDEKVIEEDKDLATTQTNIEEIIKKAEVKISESGSLGEGQASNPVWLSIVEDAKTKVLEARSYLDAGTEKQKSGATDEARELIRESHKSALEAYISLEEGAKISKDDIIE
jgi:hypothetical protein